MEDLPCVALVVVLEHLPYGDLIRFRSVNKLWRHLIDHSVSKRELLLFVSTEPCPNRWVHSGEEMNLSNTVRANYSVFKPAPFFMLFSRVRRLFLSFNHFAFSQKLTDNLVSNFSTLEHLQIDCQSSSSLDESTTFRLALRNLQTFSFGEHYINQVDTPENPTAFLFSLDCDRLTELYDISLSSKDNPFIARVAPNLKVLVTNRINYDTAPEFPNLEILCCSNVPDTRFLVACLPKLREFCFANCVVKLSSEGEEMINEFLQRIEEQRRKVDVFWLGLKFTLENSGRLFDALKQSGLPNYLGQFEYAPESLNFFKGKSSSTNFHPIHHLFECSVTYADSFGDQLDEHADRELIENLAKSWRNVILESKISGKFDVAKLSSLFRFVRVLELYQILEQSEFDALPTIFPDLRVFYMHLDGMPFFTSLEGVDFSFVSKFKNLYEFHMLAQLPLAALDRMLTDCRHLGLVAFAGKEKELYVRIRPKQFVQRGRRFQLSFTRTALECFYFKEKNSFLEFLDVNDLVALA